MERDIENMTEYEKMLAGVQRLEQMGGWQEALELLCRIKEIFPDQLLEIELQILECLYIQQQYEEALDEAASCMRFDDGSIMRWMIERYYEPFEDEAEALQRRNLEYLQQYECYYGEDDTRHIKALLYDGVDKLIFCGDNLIKKYVGTPQMEIEKHETDLFFNIVNVSWIKEQIDKTKYHGMLPNYENPAYLYYDENVFWALIQCVDLRELLLDKRVVVIVGMDQLRNFFSQSQVRYPSKLIGAGSDRINEILVETQYCKTEKMLADKEYIAHYYSHSREAIDDRIRQRRPRILFLTSYFTSVIQYHTRDLKQAAERQGLETALLIEKGSLSLIAELDFCEAIRSFCPDIIFCIDHLRFEYLIPDEIVWICWIQDPMPRIMDQDTPHKLGKRDFILNHYITWQKILMLGYPKERLMDAPVPCNQTVYKPYKLDIEETSEYGCDICFVCHASDVDRYIAELVQTIPHNLRDAVVAIYKAYQQYAYETGTFFYSKDIFKQYLQGAFEQQYNWHVSKSYIEFLTEDMYLRFNQRVYRETLVDWILDAGFTNIKLWGNGWKTNSKYAPYAMGAAKNGETLSKIYQASKIVIGNNIVATAAARAWETMLSGGFYLSNYIPEVNDLSDIRKIITVGEDVVMFYDREDLLSKLHYYLEHEDARQQMIEKGRKAALEKMTFDSLMEKTLNFVAERI